MPSPLLDLFAPARCLACGARGAQPWCPRCQQEAGRLAVGPSRCERCGTGPPDTSHGCWEPGVPIGRTVVAFRYEGPVAAAVVAAKAAGAVAAWRSLGGLLAQRCRPLAGVEVVTWVTTDPRRRRQRGVDHARELARAVAAGLGRPLVSTLEVRPGIDRGTARGRGEPDGGGPVFRSCRSLDGRRLALVDDVLTTGATVRAAVAALTAAGAVGVDVALLARAGTRRLSVIDGPRSR